MADLTIKQDSTEPIEFVLDADNISDLDDVQSLELYAREDGETSNHVDGASASVKNSSDQIIEFDPVGKAKDGGDAFDETGTYKVYVKVSWVDADTTRHPDDGFEVIYVEGHFE